MYPVNNRLHDLAFEENVKTRIRVYFISDSVDCTDDDDVQTNGTLLVGAAGDTDSNGRISFDQGVTFNEYFNPDKNIQIGTAVSSNVTMTLLNYDGALDGFSYGRCKIYLDAYDDENSVWLPCPMGVYIIDLPVKRKTKLVNVIGYDQMQKLDAVCDSWWKGLGWSSGLTILQILNSMATHLGLSVSSRTASAMVNSGLSFTAAPFDCVEVTYREVLETIAEATGTVARFNRDGEIELRWFGMPSGGGGFGESSCFSLDVAEYNVSQIDALRLKFAEGDLGVTIGSGTNEYVIQNNLFLNGANTAAITSKANPVYNRLSSFSPYAPVSGKMIYDWSLEAGDIIDISTFSAMLIVPVFQSSISWHGGNVVADVFCDGDEKRPVLDAALRDYYRLDSDMRTLVIEAPRINLLGYTTINDGFKINLDGTFEANGATINGTVKTTNPEYGQTILGNGVLEAKNLDGDTVAVFGSAEDVGVVRTEAIGYGSVELDGESLFVSDASHNTRIAASGYGGYLAVYDENFNREFLVSSGNTIINNTILTDNGNPLDINGDVDIVGSLDISGGGLDVSGAVAFHSNATIGGALDVSGASTLANTTVNGTLDVINRRYDAVLSNAGWHRAISYPLYASADELRGYVNLALDIGISRYGDLGESHRIKLFLAYGHISFADEESASQLMRIDKIRYTYDSNYGYIDIHTTVASSVRTAVRFDVVSGRQVYTRRFVAESLQDVADAPSGETIAATYDFHANGTYIDNLYATTLNGILGVESITIANNATGTVSIPNNEGVLIVSHSTYNNARYLLIAHANNSGTVYHTAINTTTTTFATSTNALSITNTSGGTAFVTILRV